MRLFAIPLKLWAKKEEILLKIYVSAAAPRSGDGTQARPYQTISEAAKVAEAGDEVIVMPGFYREWVNPVRGGESDDKRITYRSAVPGCAVITGAEPHHLPLGGARLCGNHRCGAGQGLDPLPRQRVDGAGFQQPVRRLQPLYHLCVRGLVLFRQIQAHRLRVSQ